MQSFKSYSKVKIAIFIVMVIIVLVFKSKTQRLAKERATQESATSVVLEIINKTDMKSELKSLAGLQELSLATMNKEFNYKRTEAPVLFKRFKLSSSVAQIEFNCDFHYYVDLTKEWQFQERDNHLYVVAPLLEFRRPSVDFKSLKFTVLKSSLFIDEEKTMKTLQSQIPLYLHDEAIANLELVREKSRLELVKFLQTWFVQKNVDVPKIELKFQDELKEELEGKVDLEI